MKKHYRFLVVVLVLLAASLLLFTPLDNKINDLFLRLLPPLEESPSVLLVNIDDLSIEQVGTFPWTRDIMADAIVFLKEMGARSVIFDLSYLDRSPVKVDPNYVNQELPGYVDYSFSQISDTVAQILEGYSNGILSPDDAGYYMEEFSNIQNEVKNSLNASIRYVARDVDQYFADSLSFFEHAFLTLTMIAPQHILGDDKTLDMSFGDEDWLEEHVALKNISAQNDTLTPEFIGIQPAIDVLMKSARSSGFVNAEPDKDGYRRRLHLLAKYKGHYYGQLIFVPLLEYFGNPPIEVSNSYITLKNATIKGEKRDIRIPRDTDGSVLIKWPPKRYEEYNSISAWDLIKSSILEKAFLSNLQNMEESGFFYYWDGEQTPMDFHSAAKYIREQIFETHSTDSSADIPAWLDYRQRFFESAALFLNGPAEETILSDVGDDEETAAYVREYFTETRKQLGQLEEIRRISTERVKGALCIVGTTATSTTDEGLITYQERFPNVGIHATLANMMLSEDFLDRTSGLTSILMGLFFVLLYAFIDARLADGRSIAVGIFLMLLATGIVLGVFVLSRRYIPLSVPLAAVFISFILLTLLRFLTTMKEKSFLRSAFSRYLSSDVINEIIKNPDKLNLGGEKREMTAIFTDIQKFSTISEQLSPVDLVALLNRYLTAMSDIILENQGTIDKFEGDAIIAFFGAPLDLEDHASRACRSAVLMKKAEAELNKDVMARGLSPFPLFTRIGINTGDMVVGNMGTENKMDYTMMGNEVNIAARLEGVNKQYETGGILISEKTRKQLGEEFILRRLDRVRVVGVNTPIRLYEVLDMAAEAPSELTERIKRWENAMDAFEERRYSEAGGIFSSIHTESDGKDRVAALYLKRCQTFEAKTPRSDWDGVFNLSQK